MIKRLFAILLSVSIVCGVSIWGYAAEDDTAKVYTFKSKLAEWEQVNEEVEGWLYIQGTNINYPVIFHPDDTQYYVARGYNKQPSRNGVIYAEANTHTGELKDMSLNTVIYGHNWTNVSANPRVGSSSDVMFAQLPAFHHLDFAKENQFINYTNSAGAYVFQVFAVFYAEQSFEYYYPNPDEVLWDKVMNSVKKRTIHNYDVDVKYGDHIVTMSTCTRAFGGSSEQRFVVMAKMVPAGNEKVEVTAHTDYQKPSLSY